MNSICETFSKLISPLSLEDFFLNYFDQQCVQLSSSPERFSTLFTWHEFEHVMNYHHFDDSKVNLVKGNQKISPIPFFKQPSQKVSDELIQKHLEDGFTLVIDDISQKNPKLAAFIKNIKSELSEAIFINLYFTPANSQGFKKHMDTQDVFILQIDGEKEWHLFSDADNDLSPQILHLEKGDILYIPKGVPHSAQCKNVYSLHLTLGISFTSFSDISFWIFRELMAQSNIYQQSISRDSHQLSENKFSDFIKTLQESFLKFTSQPNLKDKFLETKRHSIIKSVPYDLKSLRKNNSKSV
jgi:ribosomal protein L16 Arg81 hydroxylase